MRCSESSASTGSVAVREQTAVVFRQETLSSNQAIQWPLVELATQQEMLRLLIFRTATEMDTVTARCKAHAAGRSPWVDIERQLGHKIGMCNYYANRLCTEAADRAIQVHGGNGYSRHEPFEHIMAAFQEVQDHGGERGGADAEGGGVFVWV